MKTNNRPTKLCVLPACLTGCLWEHFATGSDKVCDLCPGGGSGSDCGSGVLASLDGCKFLARAKYGFCARRAAAVAAAATADGGEEFYT